MVSLILLVVFIAPGWTVNAQSDATGPKNIDRLEMWVTVDGQPYGGELDLDFARERGRRISCAQTDLIHNGRHSISRDFGAFGRVVSVTIRGPVGCRPVKLKLDAVALKRTVPVPFVSVGPRSIRVVSSGRPVPRTAFSLRRGDAVWTGITDRHGMLSVGDCENKEAVTISTAIVSFESGLVPRNRTVSCSVKIQTGAVADLPIPPRWILVRPVVPRSKTLPFGVVNLRLGQRPQSEWSSSVEIHAGAGVVVAGLPAQGELEILASRWGRRFIAWREPDPFASWACWNLKDLQPREPYDLMLRSPRAVIPFPSVVDPNGVPAKQPRLFGCNGWFTQPVGCRGYGPISFAEHLLQLLFVLQDEGSPRIRDFGFRPEDLWVATESGVARVTMDQLLAGEKAQAHHRFVTVERPFSMKARSWEQVRLRFKSGKVYRWIESDAPIQVAYPSTIRIPVPLDEAPLELQCGGWIRSVEVGDTVELFDRPS